MLVDVIGRLLRLALAPGNTSDIRGADLLVADAAGMTHAIANRGASANNLRATLRASDTIPVIKGRSPPQAPTPG